MAAASLVPMSALLGLVVRLARGPAAWARATSDPWVNAAAEGWSWELLGVAGEALMGFGMFASGCGAAAVVDCWAGLGRPPAADAPEVFPDPVLGLLATRPALPTSSGVLGIAFFPLAAGTILPAASICAETALAALGVLGVTALGEAARFATLAALTAFTPPAPAGPPILGVPGLLPLGVAAAAAAAAAAVALVALILAAAMLCAALGVPGCATLDAVVDGMAEIPSRAAAAEALTLLGVPTAPLPAAAAVGWPAGPPAGSALLPGARLTVLQPFTLAAALGVPGPPSLPLENAGAAVKTALVS